MGSVSNQNCCKKSSASKKTLKNTDLGNDVVWNLLVWCMNICNTILIHFQKDILLRHSNCYCFIWEWYSIPTINHHWLSLSVSGCVRVFLIQSESSTTFRSRRQMFHDVSLPQRKSMSLSFPWMKVARHFRSRKRNSLVGAKVLQREVPDYLNKENIIHILQVCDNNKPTAKVKMHKKT